MTSNEEVLKARIQELEQQLERANQKITRATEIEKATSYFMQVMLGYEVREPISRIYSAMEIATQVGLSPEEIKELQGIVIRNCQIVNNIINDVILGTQVDNYFQEAYSLPEEVQREQKLSFGVFMENIAISLRRFIERENEHYARQRVEAAQSKNSIIAHGIYEVLFIDQRESRLPESTMNLGFIQQVLYLLVHILFDTPLIHKVYFQAKGQDKYTQVVIGWNKKGGEAHLQEQYNKFPDASTVFDFVAHAFNLHLAWKIMREYGGKLELDTTELDTFLIVLSFPIISPAPQPGCAA